MNPFGEQEGTNLFSILVHIAFGFVLGLVIFIGFKEVIDCGSKLASDLLKMTGYGQQMAAFGLATTAAPYVILTPLAGLVVKQLTAVRTLKSFAYFAVAILLGLAVAFFTQGYFHSLM